MVWLHCMRCGSKYLSIAVKELLLECTVLKRGAFLCCFTSVDSVACSVLFYREKFILLRKLPGRSARCDRVGVGGDTHPDPDPNVLPPNS